MRHSHAEVPPVELFEQVRINFEQMQRGWVRHADGLHKTQQQKEIVQFGGLLAKTALVPTERGAAQYVGQGGEQVRRGQRPLPTSTLMWKAVPPKFVSPKAWEIPPLPRMPGMPVY